MSEFDYLIDRIENKRFLEKFIYNRENENRNNITIISSICEILADKDIHLTPEEYTDCVNKIMVACCSMMKLTELYTRLTKVLFDSKMEFTSVDMNRFLTEFSEKCNETLGVACDIIFEPVNKMIFAETNEDFLEYILLGCVRKAVLDGAVSVSMRLEQLSDKDILVAAETAEYEPKKQHLRFLKDLTTDELLSINVNLAKKINSVFTCENNLMLLQIKYRYSDRISLKSPARSYPTRTFTSYHNMLADLSDYKFF